MMGRLSEAKLLPSQLSGSKEKGKIQVSQHLLQGHDLTQLASKEALYSIKAGNASW